MLSNRIEIYHKLNTQLSYLSDNDIEQLFVDKEKSQGYGTNIVIEFATHKIFCKQIKITDVEYANKFDTSNLFGLPTYYNYSVGSAGINCFRELLMHIKTTNWVLNGEIENFPLLYHYRISKIPESEMQSVVESFDDEIKNWHSEAVGEYLRAKSNARYHIVLFLEHIPLEAFQWLDDNYQKNKIYLESILKIVRFLRKNNIIHFDAHLRNILVDNNNVLYLTDFGLVTDENFLRISGEEKNFYHKNSFYDYGMVISKLSHGLIIKFFNNIEKYGKKYGINDRKNMTRSLRIIFQNIDKIAIELNIDNNYIALLKKLEPIIFIFKQFIDDIIQNKHTIFPNDQIKKEMHKLTI